MKLSLSWLKEWVDLDGLSADEIAHQLTMKTALIEEVEEHGVGLADLRIGYVVAKERHPNADRLSVCEVDTGTEKVTIVCGAPNVDAGQKVPIALPGAVLPGDFKIAERPLRGVKSQGMICSAKEIGLGDDNSGIMVLSEEVRVGERLVDELGLCDSVLDIDNKSITHRPDLWGHFGFARELAAIYDRPLKPLQLANDLERGKGSVDVQIKDPDLCSRYLALTIRNLSAIPSPGRLAQRITRCGMRPINLPVDLSNYVMMEMGQPTHPFDQETLDQGIVVRRGAPGESLVTLDGIERKLGESDLLIADHRRAVAIAGVMGGSETEVSESTSTIVLESAHFDGVALRKTSTDLGLRTDALARFEKFLDPHTAEIALRRYAQLVREMAPHAEVEAHFTEASDWSYQPKVLELRPKRTRTVLGVDLSLSEMKQRLESVEFEVEEAGDKLHVTVPSFRATRDVEVEEDLIEEVGRLHGYENISEDLPRVSCAPPVRDRLRELESAITQALVERCGMTEVLDYSMVDDRSLELIGDDDNENYLELRNPVTVDTRRMRRSLIPGMFRFLEANDRHQDRFQLFQLGRSYLAEGRNEEGLPRETRELVLIEAHPKKSSDRNYEALATLKGRLELLCQAVDSPLEWRAFSQEEGPYWAHPTRLVDAVLRHPDGDRVIGTVGEVHPEWLMRLGLDRDVALGWFDVEAWLACGQSREAFEPLAKYPSVKIDLALVAGYDMTIAQIESEILDEGQGLVRSVDLFDVFVGKQVPEGRRSLAFRLLFRSDDRTLNDQEVLERRDAIVRRLEEKGLALR